MLKEDIKALTDLTLYVILVHRRLQLRILLIYFLHWIGVL